MNRTIFSSLLTVICLLPMFANATLIIDQSQTNYTGTWQAINLEPSWNQSFTAGSDNIAGAGIYLDSWNGGPYEGTMTLEIWDGLINVGGTMLASGTTVTNPSQAHQWVDVFWNAVTLDIGNTYYLRVTGDNPSGHGYSNGNLYSGGSVFNDNGYAHSLSYDLTFRTYTDDGGVGEVPEPTILALFSTGLLGLAGMARRKKA